MSDTDDDLPADPDLDDVDDDLRILQGVDYGIVRVLCEDGVSHDALVVAPPLHAHARRLAEGDD
jgi:hypothetical protein